MSATQLRVERAGLVVLQHVDKRLGRAKSATAEFVDQLSDERLALGDLSLPSVRGAEAQNGPFVSCGRFVWDAFLEIDCVLVLATFTSNVMY
jgi:hypothetical protein